MIDGLCEIFIVGLHKIFKGLSKWECSFPSRCFDNKFDVGQGLILFISQSDFKMAAHLQEVSTSSFLQAIIFCSRYMSHMATTTRSTLSCIILQNRERLHCSSQKRIETMDQICYRCRQRQGNYTFIWSGLNTINVMTHD